MSSVLNFNQISTLLATVMSQATGKTVLTPTNTNDFVSVASMAERGDIYDPILQAIGVMTTRTLFDTEAPYSAKFKGLRKDSQEWGAITRELHVIDKPFENDVSYQFMNDGDSVDQWKVNKPEVIQTTTVGSNVYEKSMSIHRDQLKSAFTGPDQFSEFMGMIMTNRANMIEQAKEDMLRMCLANMIGGTIASEYEYQNNRVFYAITEYNAVTGLSLTAQTVYQPANYLPFCEWLVGRVKTISDLMTERTTLYHVNIENKPITRHLPKSQQALYLYAPETTMQAHYAFTNAFHTDGLNWGDYEKVNFWQSISSPSSVKVAPNYLATDGTVKFTEGTEITPVFGVLCDKNALGVTSVNEWSSTTPINSKGGYAVMYDHFCLKYFNQYLRNFVVIMLD